jgi:hypothetical protein
MNTLAASLLIRCNFINYGILVLLRMEGIFTEQKLVFNLILSTTDFSV